MHGSPFFERTIQNWLSTTAQPVGGEHEVAPPGYDYPINRRSHIPLELSGSVQQDHGSVLETPGPDRPQEALSEPEDHEEEINPYARRPRRKTREDKYVLKEQQLKCYPEKTKVKRKTTTGRHRRETAGTTLLHRYSADNVVSDRLTLKPVSNLGLFGKGKTSSPFKQRALPDLAFSEIKFSTQNDHPRGCAATHGRCGDKKRKLSEVQDDELSKFFAAGKSRKKIPADSVNKCRPKTSPLSGDLNGVGSGRVDLDDAIPPFLGFGQLAPHRSTPDTSQLKSTARASRTTPVGVQSHSQFSWSRSPTTIRTRLRRQAAEYQHHNREENSTDDGDGKVDSALNILGARKELRETTSHHRPAATIAEASTQNFLHELGELVTKWKDRHEEVRVLQDVTHAAPESLRQAERSAMKDDDEAVVTTLTAKQDASEQDEIANGRGGPTIPSETAQTDLSKKNDDAAEVRGPDQAYAAQATEQEPKQPLADLTHNPMAFLPHRTSSGDHMTGFAWSASPVQPILSLSVRPMSIYEQQAENQVEDDQLTNEMSSDIFDHRRQRYTTTSSMASPVVTNPTSIYSNTYDRGLVRSNTSNMQNNSFMTPIRPLRSIGPHETITRSQHDIQQCQSPDDFRFQNPQYRHALHRPSSRPSTLSYVTNGLANFSSPLHRSPAPSIILDKHSSRRDRKPSAPSSDIIGEKFSETIANSSIPRNFWTPQRLY